MSKELVISATPHETRVALLEEGQLCEIYIEREKEFALVGSIYKGRVTRVLPGMQSAFVDIGLDSDAFLYVSDFLENLEEYDHIVTTVEGKAQKMEQQGGQVFAPPPAAPSAPLVTQSPEPPASPAPAGPTVSEGAPPSNASVPAGSMPAPGAAPYQRRGREQGSYSPEGGGRGRRGGRWGRRGRGGDRYQGRDRDLPPSKYAAPRPYQHRPYEPPQQEREHEPVLLPGESLAKYKDRTPAAPAAPAFPPTEPPAPTVEQMESAAPEQEWHAPPAEPELGPEAKLAIEPVAESAPPAAPEPVAEKPWAEETLPDPPESSFFQLPPLPSEALAESYTAEELPAPIEEPFPDARLTEEEASALAEQLAEAKHEEAQAQAEEGELAEEEEAPLELHSESYEAVEPHEETISAEAAEGEGGHEAVQPAAPPVELEPQPFAARVEERPRARFQRPMRRGGRPRGRFVRRRDSHQPRRPQLISELLKANEEIIVQIAKEPLGKKGARITSHVALPGRYLVYMPTVDHIGVSRKINSAEERARLRRVVAESKGTFPGGFIVRTAAEGASDEEIRSDVEFLGRTWSEIRTHAEQRKAPALLHRDLNLVERILRDYLSSDYSAIWIDNEEEFSKVVDFVGRFQPRLVSRVKLYTKDAPIFEEFGIQQELDKALRPKVWLKSGGYIVINHTEALVAIDVNTGKYVGRGSTRLEDTIVKTNLEAVKEIVRQIRLRDLGGIIVVDFIDMEERRNREKVMVALDDALRSDRAPSKVLSFNEFGLVAITRKRTKQALERVLCQPCPYCTGSGMVKSVPTICYEIQAEARKMSADLDSQSLTLRVHPEIARALKTRESSLIEELEQATRKSVIIQSDPTLHWEQYDIY
ncbi:MAG TPA: Rne/Rng family ribonuclease [Candidatus Acidoferrales bacterium]|nr:Rne/Rng family ribonuclease [Candidatus Acidoferrales bacterium]